MEVRHDLDFLMRICRSQISENMKFKDFNRLYYVLQFLIRFHRELKKVPGLTETERQDYVKVVSSLYSLAISKIFEMNYSKVGNGLMKRQTLRPSTLKNLLRMCGSTVCGYSLHCSLRLFGCLFCSSWSEKPNLLIKNCLGFVSLRMVLCACVFIISYLCLWPFVVIVFLILFFRVMNQVLC
jgi:hypothetical protein